MHPIFQHCPEEEQALHPMIYMRGLKVKNLLAIVDLIYHGETKIYQ